MTRRQAIAIAASGAIALRAQSGGAANEPKKQLPALCVSSKALGGLGYAEMGDIVKQLGFDGVDLTVMAGGTVEPSQAPVDEVRAFESMHGATLLAPIITTGLTSPTDPWCRTVLALAGRTGVGLFKSALNKRSGPQSQAARTAYVLAYLGREYKIAMLVRAGAGVVDYNLDSAQTLVGTLDPKWSGISLNSDCFAAKSGVTEEQLRDILPLVKAVAISDLEWAQPGREPVAVWKPLGKGSVDFRRMFEMLARSGFNGPLTVERNYAASDEPGALSRDMEFVRKQIQTAYGTPKS